MKLIVGLFTIVAGMFMLFFLLGAGILAALFARLFGRPRRSPQDVVLLQSLATLAPGEQALLADAISRGEPVIANLSDQASLDALVAKGIVLADADELGVMEYRIAGVVWDYLRKNR